MSSDNPTTASDLVLRPSSSLTTGLRGARLKDVLFGRLILFNAVLIISVIFLIFVYVGKEALPILHDRGIQKEANLRNLFLPQTYGSAEMPLPYVWQPVAELPKYSIMPLLQGTLKVTLVALLFAAPLAIAAAIYTAEFAPHQVRELVKPVIELLAGIPSVVLGCLALIVLATWVQDLFNFDYRLNVIIARCACG